MKRHYKPGEGLLRNEHGFTLLEVLITAAIFSIGIVSILLLSTVNIRGTQDSTRLLTAQRLAKAKLEEFNSRTAPTLVSGSETPDVDEDGNPDIYTVNWTITAAPGGCSYVYVDVSWHEDGSTLGRASGGRDRHVKLYGMVAPQSSGVLFSGGP